MEDEQQQTDDRRPVLDRARREQIGLAYALVRIGLGINILMHGVSRLGDVPGFAEAIGSGFAETFVPAVLAEAFAYVIVAAEIGVGGLLTAGLWTRGAAVAGGLLMWPLIFGINLQQKWTVAGLQLIYLGLYAVLIAAASFDRYAVDRLLNDS